MNTPDAGPPTRVRWLVFGLAGATSWLLYLHRYSWGVVKPALKREYPELTDAQLGLLDAAFNATYALGQVPGGLAGDLLGPRAVLTLIILAWSLLVAGTAWAHGFWSLGAVRSLFGAAQAGTYPVLNQVTRRWFPLTVRTSVQGAVAALGRVGAACASVVVASFLVGALGLSWRQALVVLAGPGVVLAGAFWLAFRNSPREHPWTNAAEREVVEAGEVPPVPGERIALDLGRASAFNLGVLLFYAFTSTFADMLYVFWIPLFLVEGKGLSDAAMGWFAALPLLGGAVGGIVGGALNDRLIRATGNRRWSRSGVAGTGKMVAAVLIALSVPVADGRLVMLVLLVCKFFADWSQPTLWGTVTDIAGRASGTVFGIVNMTGVVGGVLASPVMGYLKATQGWSGLFYGVAGVYLAAALSWLFIDCTRRLVLLPVAAAPRSGP